jgi:hypothetical protein
MSANNPTGMGDITAMRFRKIARDIQMYNQDNKYFYHHHSNSAAYSSSPITLIERFIQNIFR